MQLSSSHHSIPPSRTSRLPCPLYSSSAYKIGLWQDIRVHHDSPYSAAKKRIRHPIPHVSRYDQDAQARRHRAHPSHPTACVSRTVLLVRLCKASKCGSAASEMLLRPRCVPASPSSIESWGGAPRGGGRPAPRGAPPPRLDAGCKRSAGRDGNLRVVNKFPCVLL